MRLVVVGAGITGLAGARAAALEARSAGLELEVVVLEAAGRPGGKLLTEDVGAGLTVEWGPDAFLGAKPRGRALVEEVGLGDQLVAVAPGGRRAFLLRGGTLHTFPPGLVMGIPTSAGAARRAVRAGLLSRGGGLRAAVEPLLPGRPIGVSDEPAATVVRRRLGDEAATRLVEPLLRGVFGTPGSDVGVRSALPRAVGHRSLARAMRASGTPSDHSPFLALRGGFGTLVNALVAALPEGAVRTGTPAEAVTPVGDGFGVGGLRTDAVLVTAPAPAAAEAIAPVAPRAAEALRGIRYSASAVVVLRYPADSMTRTLDGSGFLVDPDEGLSIAACSWFSSKWPHLTGDRVVLRAVVTDPEGLSADDDALAARVAAEVGRVMGGPGEPDFLRLHRWSRALPIFAPGHRDRMREATAALPERIAVAGAFLGGVGIPDCIESGENGARRLVAALARRGDT